MEKQGDSVVRATVWCECECQRCQISAGWWKSVVSMHVSVKSNVRRVDTEYFTFNGLNISHFKS